MTGAVERTLRATLAARQAGVPPDTSCFRWVDHELDGVTVDRFGPVAVLSLYREVAAEEEQALAGTLGELGQLEAVYVKRRPREAHHAASRDPELVAPSSPLWGARRPTVLARERGLTFEIRPENGLSVGLYLDARDARALVRQEAKGRRVLNTFAYTCGFGVAAAAGGAASTLNVDLSRKVLEWGAANHRHGGFPAPPGAFLAGDAFEVLRREGRRGARFDLVILDPPGFATTGKRRFRAERDYHALVAAAAAVLDPGGLLVALCNVVSMSERDFDHQLRLGFEGVSARWVQAVSASPVDFRQPSALKGQVVERR